MCKGTIIRITWLLCSVLLSALHSNLLYGQISLQASLKDLTEKQSSSPQQVISQLSHRASTDYYAVVCTGELDLRAIPAPLALRASQDSHALMIEDQRYDLGCNASGFMGYFDPSRWMDTNIKSAGGVDVTGAPGQLLVEGTNNYPVVVADRRAPRFTVKMPSNGYVTFNWKDYGGSLSNPTALAVFVDARPIEASSGQVAVFLRAGESLHFQIDPKATQAVQIHQFTFLSDLAYLITREWVNEAREIVASQYIAVEKPNLGDIRFPRNTQVAHSIQPEHTGFPVLDSDGNAQTTADQIALFGTFNGVQVSFTDKIDAEKHRIFRTWTINDSCGANVISQVQELYLATPSLKPGGSSKEDNKVKHNSTSPAAESGGSYSSSFLVFN